jgi:hypothetical protein
MPDAEASRKRQISGRRFPVAATAARLRSRTSERILEAKAAASKGRILKTCRIMSTVNVVILSQAAGSVGLNRSKCHLRL